MTQNARTEQCARITLLLEIKPQLDALAKPQAHQGPRAQKTGTLKQHIFIKKQGTLQEPQESTITL